MRHARSDLPAISQKQRELRSSSLARHHRALPPTAKMTPCRCPNPPRGVRLPDCCASTMQSAVVLGASPHPGLRLDEADFGVVRSPSSERANRPIFADQVRLPSTTLSHPDAFSAAHCRPSPLQPLPHQPSSNVGAPPSPSHHRRCPVVTLRLPAHEPSFRVPRRFCPPDASHVSPNGPFATPSGTAAHSASGRRRTCCERSSSRAILDAQKRMVLIPALHWAITNPLFFH